jgi:hypothetical protein
LVAVPTAQTGEPYTINSVYDVNGDGNLTDRLNTTQGLSFGPVTGDRRVLVVTTTNDLNLLLAPIGQSGIVGRNTFRSAGLWNLDLALGRTWSLPVVKRVVVRAEVFNAFNHANFGIPVRFLEAPGFGTSVNTVAPNRTIQIALKKQF